MEGINLDGIFDSEQTSEEVEAVEETTEEILDEQISEEEVEEVEEETEEEIEEEEVRNYDDVEIDFQDEGITKLSDYTNEDIKKYIQLGKKAEFQIEKANVKAKNTVSDFDKVAEAYGLETQDLLTQLMDQIFESKSQEPGGKDEGRHIDDIRKEFNSNNKGFKERSIESLLDAYPELTADTIPGEVLQDLKFGRDISDSYEKHLLNTEKTELTNKVEALEKELKTLKQNSKAKKKAFVKGKAGQTGKAGSSLLNEIDKILS